MLAAGLGVPVLAQVGPNDAAPSKMLSAKLEPFENRLIRAVTLEGVRDEDRQLALNQIRVQPGQPLRVSAVQADVQRLTRLGRFKQITAQLQTFDDQSVGLIYSAAETPVVKLVQLVGNRQLGDAELGAEIDVLVGTPIDPYQIDRTLRKVRELYRKKGYYQADVTVDEKELKENQILLYRIREGERVKVTDIRFEGNASFSEKELRPALKTDVWGIFRDGVLDDLTLDQDLAELLQYYKDRGHLDVRADRRVQPAPNGREAVVTFIIEEGPRYTLRDVRVELAEGAGTRDAKEPTVYTRAQIAGLIPLKSGETYSLDKVRKSIEAMEQAYQKLGYIDARVVKFDVRQPGAPVVDLLLVVSEGKAYKTGVVDIVGNELTQQKVIRRQVRLKPDRPLDGVALRESEDKLKLTRLFGDQRPGEKPPKLTVQAARSDEPDHRDVLVEVQETNTGSLQFGAAVGSDGGVIGTIGFSQRNFDLTDYPESWDELIRGRAFRGAGQEFSLVVQPGTEIQNYTISLTDPRLFESDYSGSVAGGFRTRKFEEYDEERLYANLGAGRRFGDRWTGNVQTRVERINIRNVNPFEPFDIQNDKGDHFLTGVKFNLVRTSVDNPIRPTRGSIIRGSVEQVLGDYTFNLISGDIQTWVTIAEDVLGRKTILSMRLGGSYIPQDQKDVPVYERLYLGGRDMRGFRFRGISPRGLGPDPLGGATPVQTTRAIGGRFAMNANLQLEQPLVDKYIAGVAFMDTGTVDTKFSVSKYRVAVGLGVRVYLPQLGQAPLAFDFGFPIKKEKEDNKRYFSFSFDVPF